MEQSMKQTKIKAKRAISIT